MYYFKESFQNFCSELSVFIFDWRQDQHVKCNNIAQRSDVLNFPYFYLGVWNITEQNDIPCLVWMYFHKHRSLFSLSQVVILIINRAERSKNFVKENARPFTEYLGGNRLV